MPNSTFTFPEDLVRAEMIGQRMLELQRNAEVLVDELDGLILSSIRRVFPGEDSFAVNAELEYQARRRLAAEESL
jgi:hypothetical protein